MQTKAPEGSHEARAASKGSPEFPIAIIGCGFSGIGTAIQLKKAGILSFTIFERAGEIGGTWRDNTYPGAACDVPSAVYSFSFEPNPNWTRKFAGSAEIQNYLLGCVDKYNLREHLRLNTGIVDAAFDEARGVWTLTTDSGEKFLARAVVSAMGGLVNPSYPDIKGIESFAGKSIHTARWDHDYDLAGKRVGVIGTGASAIQVIPAIASKVAKLSVFQRTPAWVMPRGEKAVSERRKERYRRHPFLMRLLRWSQFWFSEIMGPIVMLDSPRLSSVAEAACRKHLESSVKAPELRKKLTPDFQFGCKRILISDDYLSTYERKNVELVTEGIAEIRPGGVATVDGVEHPLDVLIHATGFEVSFTAPGIPIAGLGGKTVREMWEKSGANAYKGVVIAGVPNWFVIMGPNTGPGHTSVLIYTEAQIRYIVQGIKKLIAEDIRYLNVRQDVQDRYNEGLQGRMKYTVWQSGCKSWYLDVDGKNHALYPGFATEYRARIRRFKQADYEVVGFETMGRGADETDSTVPVRDAVAAEAAAGSAGN